MATFNIECERLNDLISNNQNDEAHCLIKASSGHVNIEKLVLVVLGSGASSASTRLIHSVLNQFLLSRENTNPEHGYWVHSLSHFTSILWEKKMYSWIKIFNETAFKGAKELGDTNCSDRLISDFVQYAEWNFNPAVIGLSKESLTWMKPDSCFTSNTMDRLSVWPFNSEEEYLCWELRKIKSAINNFELYHDCQSAVKETRSFLDRLVSLNFNTREFNSLESDLLIDNLVRYRKRIELLKNDNEPDWRIKNAEADIKEIEEMLKNLDS